MYQTLCCRIPTDAAACFLCTSVCASHLQQRCGLGAVPQYYMGNKLPVCCDYDRVSNHGGKLLKMTTASLLSTLPVYEVISEHSVHGDSANKKGQASLEASC